MLNKRLLGVDEMSLLTTEILALLNQVLSVVRSIEEAVDETVLFGDMGMLLTGDFHQFPPIAQLKKALFSGRPPTALAQVGREIFEQFDTVVELVSQMRITDPTWNAILDRARYGQCTAADLQEIRTLVITEPTCEVPDFQVSPWNEAVLITPRNSVRSRWNKSAINQHCKTTGHVLYISPAEDTVNEAPLTMHQRLIAARLSTEENRQLNMKVAVAVGMKTMVTENVATSINLANGSRAVIVDIVLDQREGIKVPTSTTEGVHLHHLQYPPRFIVLQLDFCDTTSLPSLKKKEVPLFPIMRKFRINSDPPAIVTRRQLPITPAYAFTDFKAQGQTLQNVIIDIGKTANFKLTPFNAYVGLSRGTERRRIRLLRDFEDYLFTTPPSEDLKREEERLRRLAKRTKDDYYAGLYGPVHEGATRK